MGLSQGLRAAPAFPFQGTGTLTPVSPPHLRRPSWAAAPPGMILVMKMDGSSPMCGLSVPPAMLKPRPELPWAGQGEERQPSALPAPGRVTGGRGTHRGWGAVTRAGRDKAKSVAPTTHRHRDKHRQGSGGRGPRSGEPAHPFQCDLLVFHLPLCPVHLQLQHGPETQQQ